MRNEQVVFFAEHSKCVETFLFLFAEAESKTLAVIKCAKYRIHLRMFGDQIVQMLQVVRRLCAQGIGERYRAAKFRPNEPKGINERQPHEMLPPLA